MELQKKSYRYYAPAAAGRTQYEESGDMIVPDSYPDAKAIRGSAGEVFLKEKTVQNDRILISGVIRAAVFYEPEEGEGVRELVIPVSFAHIEEAKGLSSGDQLHVEAKIHSLHGALLNPRKLSVQAKIDLSYEAYSQREAELVTDVDSEPEERIQLRRRSVQPGGVELLLEKTMPIVDSVDCSGMGKAAEVVVWDTEILEEDVKLIAGKAVVKGSLRAKLLLTGLDGKITPKICTFPFSQIIEVPDLTDDDALACRFSLQGLDFTLDEESEGGRYDVNGSLFLVMEGRKKREFSVVCDLYSAAFPHESDIRLLYLPVEPGMQRVTREGSESVETEQRPAEILFARGALSPGEREEGTIGAELSLSVFYRDSADGACTAEKVVPVTFETNGWTGDRWQMTTPEVSAELMEDGSVRIAWRCGCALMDGGQASVPQVTEARLLEEPLDPGKNAPALIMRWGSAGDALWDMAKAYHTTEGEIREANELPDSETLTSDGILLIPLMR